jgi:hypothetical protein
MRNRTLGSLGAGKLRDLKWGGALRDPAGKHPTLNQSPALKRF